MFCPRCEAEYRPGFSRCSDCGVDLVDSLEQKPARSRPSVDDAPVVLCCFTTTFEAGIAHLQEIYFVWRPVLRDPSNDHVLEVAVEAGCALIVTHNVRDFVGSESFGVAAVKPGEFLRRIGDTK